MMPRGTGRLRTLIQTPAGLAWGWKGKSNLLQSHGVIVCLLCLFVTQSAYIFSFDYHKPLTFEDRVMAQEAIERVYYNHRIWPKENPQPKPPFEAMVTRIVMEGKVTDYLKKSAALGKYWERPVTGEQLQAEMDRMAKQTKDPATLRELFAALNNDPYLIAECLARPMLADRLIRNWYAYDERFHREARKRAEAALEFLIAQPFSKFPEAQCDNVSYRLEGSQHSHEAKPRGVGQEIREIDQREFDKLSQELPAQGALSVIEEKINSFAIVHTLRKGESELEYKTLHFPKISLEKRLEGMELSPVVPSEADVGTHIVLPAIDDPWCTEGWDNGILDDVPDGMEDSAAVWTGAEMLVWPTWGPSNLGWRYNPSTDSWVRISIGANAPEARFKCTVVWTGSEMIVWGGSDLATGARYNPSTDSWIPTSTGANSPSGRSYHTAVWTGTEMIVWGGKTAGNPYPQYFNTGGRYNPTTDSWQPTSTGANVPSLRYGHIAVWAGTQMIVWGGYYSATLNTGGCYNPFTDSWSPTSMGANAPSARTFYTAAWTGSEMIIWGGHINSYPYETNTGARYNPLTNSWASTSIGTNVPSARDSHTAVWTGSEMIVWGGLGDGPTSSGGRYNPMTDSWLATSDSGTPFMRFRHAAVWTGMEMIVWGGRSSAGKGLNSGGRYNPSLESWLPTSTGANMPSARYGHSSVWTGAEMIVWGGRGDFHFNTGGAYNPSTDSWTSASLGFNVPSARKYHTAIWTGSEMIIWGGIFYDGSTENLFNSGGRYDPLADYWLPTSLGPNLPEGRYGHTAVWTGIEMIVWGGDFDESAHLCTGGKYDPSTDSWLFMSIGYGVPSARHAHTAVWTGTNMIIWGGACEYYNGDTGDVVSCYLNSGGLYDPSADSWSSTANTIDTPVARAGHTAIWSGDEMIIWGGYYDDYDNFYVLDSGARYDPSNDTWNDAVTALGAPLRRRAHTAVWTGSEMIVWGGISDGYPYYLNSGGIYNVEMDSWAPTIEGPNLPACRAGQTAVWTGMEMIVWGGHGYSGIFNTGGRYKPNRPPGSSNNSPICSGQTLALATDSVPGATYSWTGPNGFLSEEQNPVIPEATPDSSGTYFVTATAGGCALPTGFTTAIIHPQPEPAISGELSGCSSPGVMLATQAFSTYQWQKDGAVISGATGQTYLSSVSGRYRVRVTSGEGCVGVSAERTVALMFCSDSEVSPKDSYYPLRISKDPLSMTGCNLYFQKISGAAGYNVYTGVVGEWYSHGGNPFGRVCGIPATDLGTGEMQIQISPTTGNHYYLVTAFGGIIEGPSGYDSSGLKIPDLLNTCAP